MKKFKKGQIITAIDIGTTKICVLIAHKDEFGALKVIGIGKVPSTGLKKGVVVDIAKATQSIKAAKQEAELMAHMSIDSAIIGISGAHIQSRDAYGAVPLEKGVVQKEDIDHVIAAAKAVPLKEGQQVLHVLPQFFMLDNQDRIADPLGMHGIRLEAQVHIISGSVTSVQDLMTCCKMAGIQVTDIILEQLASSYAVLNDDERELGVAVLDIGGGTSDLALYKDGSICHTMVLPVAGNQFTSDVALGLRTTVKDAERIKKDYGIAHSHLLIEDTELEIEMVQGIKTRMVRRSDLLAILEPRAQELLSLIHEHLLSKKLLNVPIAGLVLTGGGALLEGLKETAEDMFNIPVRIGRPRATEHEPEIMAHPLYATGYGLLVYFVRNAHAALLYDDKKNNVSKLIAKMKSWVSHLF